MNADNFRLRIVRFEDLKDEHYIVTACGPEAPMPAILEVFDSLRGKWVAVQMHSEEWE